MPGLNGILASVCGGKSLDGSFGLQNILIIDFFSKADYLVLLHQLRGLSIRSEVGGNSFLTESDRADEVEPQSWSKENFSQDKICRGTLSIVKGDG